MLPINYLQVVLFFAHGKIRRERFRGYVLMRVRPFHTFAHGK